MFWADTAVFGSRPATECGLKFSDPTRLCSRPMRHSIRRRWAVHPGDVEGLDSLDIPEADRQKIYEGNAEQLFDRRF